jgi:lysozyme
MGQKISAPEAEELLRKDLVRFEKAVGAGVRVPFSQNQYDALVSLAFNIGVGAFSRSTLLRLLNAGKHTEAADQFLRWNKAGGKELKGLTTRRKDERALYLS